MLGSGHVAALVFATALLTAHSVGAQSAPSVTLDYHTLGAGCPQERTFRDIVAARLGYDPFAAPAERTVVARIEGVGALRGQVQLLDERGAVLGSRVIDVVDTRCADLAETMAVAVAIMLDPFGEHRAQARPEPSADAPVAAIEPPVEPESIAEPEPAAPISSVAIAAAAEATDPDPPGEPMRLVVRPGLVTSYGSVPSPTLGPWIAIGIRQGFWSLALEAGADLMPAVVSLDEGDRVQAHIISGAASGCVHYEVLVGCLGIELGALLARGPDLVPGDMGSDLFGATDVRVGVDVPLLDGMGFFALVELRIPWFVTELRIDSASVWAPSPVAGRLLVGLSLSIS